MEGELYKPSSLFVRLTAKHVSGLFLARTYGHANQLLGPQPSLFKGRKEETIYIYAIGMIQISPN